MMDDLLAATQHDLFWLPDHVEVVDEPDLLAIRSQSGRLLHNQVLRIGLEADVPAVLNRIAELYSTPHRVLAVPPQHGDLLERLLPEQGYQPCFRGRGYTMATDAPVPAPTHDVRQVTDVDSLRDNVSVMGGAFSKDPVIEDRDLALCTGPGRRSVRFVAYVDGRPAGAANLNVYPDLRFGFLWAGCVLPEHRGRGVYRALLEARRRWSHEHGLDHMGLYAKLDTSAPIVAGLGFDAHGLMAYWDSVQKI